MNTDVTIQMATTPNLKTSVLDYVGYTIAQISFKLCNSKPKKNMS